MDVQVWWSSLAEAGRDLLAVLDETERNRLESLDRPGDRGRSMVGAALLRVVAAQYLGVAPTDVVVDRRCAECGGQHGPPRIVRPAGCAPWVSVSHSGVLVVVASSVEGPVGVDVQRVADLPDRTLGGQWVGREALVKARAAAGSDGRGRWASVATGALVLEPPSDGYVAALATAQPRDRAGAVLAPHVGVQFVTGLGRWAAVVRDGGA